MENHYNKYSPFILSYFNEDKALSNVVIIL